MNALRTSRDIRLAGGYSEYEIDTGRDIELTFSAEEDCDVFIRITGGQNIRLRTYTAAGVKATYLFWNETEEKLELDESHEVMHDADLHLAYCEANRADTKRNTWVALREEGAKARVSSAALVMNDKHFDVDVVSFKPHTYGYMDNYSVVLEGGRYYMNAIGKIVKGAYGSESHQTSRSLSFDKEQRSEIIPTLLIDENDVQASHAMSVGRVDEDVLYYMMSRGLTMAQCTQLISTGYLLPIAATIDNEDLQKKLREELEEKIERLCSM